MTYKPHRPITQDPVVAQLDRMRRERRISSQGVADYITLTLGEDVTAEAVRSWGVGRRNPRLPHLRAYADLFGLQLGLTPAEDEDPTPDHPKEGR